MLQNLDEVDKCLERQKLTQAVERLNRYLKS